MIASVGTSGRIQRTLVDVIPSVVLSATAVHEQLYNHSGIGVWLVAQTAAWVLVVRRRFPQSVLALTLALAAYGWWSDDVLFAHLGALVALHWVALACSRRRAIGWWLASEVVAVLVSFRVASTGSVNDYAVILGAAALAALLLGQSQRGQRESLAALEERTHQLEVERRNSELLAAAAERTRIAREIHDVVAHSVSVMTALSEGAAAAADPRESRATMRQVAATGREALTELRRVLSVLRDGSADRQPQPAVGDLIGLVDDVRGTGLDVELDLIESAVAGLPAPLQVTIFRIVQESLTNTLKHADDATRARVVVRVVDDLVDVAVQDDGGPAPDRPRLPGAGSGLRGMRERVEAFGGRLSAGPSAQGGWLVSCRLRVNAAPLQGESRR